MLDGRGAVAIGGVGKKDEEVYVGVRKELASSIAAYGDERRRTRQSRMRERIDDDCVREARETTQDFGGIGAREISLANARSPVGQRRAPARFAAVARRNVRCLGGCSRHEMRRAASSSYCSGGGGGVPWDSGRIS